ncbi:MAG: hypothetical protein HOO67_04645 [Candidatus Peribacteraceae bacterium]|nr:hypothetical protein [Candidatus Peribacteraceae bacterium]
MSGVIPVTKNGITYALFILGRPVVDGAKFFTQQTDEFQVGIIERPAGHQVKAHQHPGRNETVRQTSEFLYVEKGKAKVTVFDDDWAVLHEQVIEAGDIMVSFRGGHEFTMLEPIRFIEVKQGPYPGDASAKVFKQ